MWDEGTFTHEARMGSFNMDGTPFQKGTKD